MKSFIRIFGLLLLVSLFHYCKKDDDIPIVDGDGNVYTSIKIGSQVWLTENLKTTRYNDNISLPMVTDQNSWSGLISPAYCWYDNDEITYKNTYGALYNWYAVNTGKLCPVGWHVPTDTEWTIMKEYLINNGFGYEGSGDDIAKSIAGTSGWTSSGTPGTIGNDQASNNSCGFTALPGGLRDFDGSFSSVGDNGSWWGMPGNTPHSRHLVVLYNSGSINEVAHLSIPPLGFSVRCMKD